MPRSGSFRSATRGPIAGPHRSKGVVARFPKWSIGAGGAFTNSDWRTTPKDPLWASHLALLPTLRYCLVTLAGIGEGSGPHAPRAMTVNAELSLPGICGDRPSAVPPVPGSHYLWSTVHKSLIADVGDTAAVVVAVDSG